MRSPLAEALALQVQPVGVYFTNTKPEDALEFDEDKRVCIVSMLNSATKGKTVALREETCTCNGGAVGLCFGDGFTKRGARITELLSTGYKGEGSDKLPPFLQHGERYFASPELVQQWKDSLPYAEAPEKYRVFAPLEKWEEDNPPNLVFLFVNPDELSALVIMSGYMRGTMVNVIAPMVSACQSILLAYDESEKAQPKAIMGGFDIAQRYSFSKELLTLTMPYSMYQEIEDGVSTGCLTTESWQKIVGR